VRVIYRKIRYYTLLALPANMVPISKVYLDGNVGNISVSLLTMVRAIIRCSIPGKGRNVSLLHNIETAAGTHSSVITSG
jgi:hypothetical protein